MKIRDFEIRNFKGLTAVRLDSCGTINAIVGKNNSGKSSVLHAIDMAGLALSLRRWDLFQPKLEVKDLFADVGQFELAIGFDNGSRLSLTADAQYGPQFRPGPTAEQRIKTVLVLPDISGGMLDRRHQTPLNVIQQVENRNYSAVNALDILFAIKFYAQKSERGFTPETYRGLIDEIKHYFPDIEDVESGRTEQDIATLTYSEYGRRLDILYSGTGLKHFLDVLIKTTVSGASVVLLDEPELGLHPDLQRRFVEYLTLLAQIKGTQFFLATHSQVLLNYAESITYFRITNAKGTRELISVTTDAVDTLLSDLGLRPSDVLNQDICLLVEGATDVIYFEHVIRVLYKDAFQKTALGILQYGGGAAEGIVSGSIRVANIVPAQKYTFWIHDRDAPPEANPNTNATQFRNALQRDGLECHIFSKREIEYYFPASLLIEAQQGDKTKEAKIIEILNGPQTQKFRDTAAAYQLCVPAGKYLRELLEKHVVSRDTLDKEIRDIIEVKLFAWRDNILGD